MGLAGDEPPNKQPRNCIAEAEAVFFACFLGRNQPEGVCLKEQIAYYEKCIAGKASN